MEKEKILRVWGFSSRFEEFKLVIREFQFVFGEFLAPELKFQGKQIYGKRENFEGLGIFLQIRGIHASDKGTSVRIWGIFGF